MRDRIVLAGGSGFLGRALAAELAARGNEVVILTRSPAAARGDVCAVREVHWDGRTLGVWAREIDGAAAVVGLAGKNVNCRYTQANRSEINASRVDSVRVMDEAIARCAHPPAVLVQAASAAIYGDAGDAVLDETAPAGRGFPVETCLLWEGAFAEGAALTPHTRRVLLRTSFVLGRGGGALGTLEKITRAFLGGAIGSGRQYISWLHLRDFVRIVLWMIDSAGARGVYNVTAPSPVTNAVFMRSLRRALQRPWSPPVPAWAVQIGSWLMRTEAELALTGRRVVPARLLAEGFRFDFTSLDAALGDLFPSGRATGAAATASSSPS